jgi:hypothetical protein
MQAADKINHIITHGRAAFVSNFYDILSIFENAFDAGLLSDCFTATCISHNTNVPATIDECAAFSENFAKDNARQWRDLVWPGKTGRPFLPHSDPEFQEVVRRVAHVIESIGLLSNHAATMSHHLAKMEANSPAMRK